MQGLVPTFLYKKNSKSAPSHRIKIRSERTIDQGRGSFSLQKGISWSAVTSEKLYENTKSIVRVVSQNRQLTAGSPRMLLCWLDAHKTSGHSFVNRRRTKEKPLCVGKAQIVRSSSAVWSVRVWNSFCSHLDASSGPEQLTSTCCMRVCLDLKVSQLSRNQAISLHMHLSPIAGAYVPLTAEGTIVVDEILASCYDSFDHDLAHIALTPIRWYPDLIEWIFGHENGSPTYVNILRNLGRWILPPGLHNKTPKLWSVFDSYLSFLWGWFSWLGVVEQTPERCSNKCCHNLSEDFASWKTILLQHSFFHRRTPCRNSPVQFFQWILFNAPTSYCWSQVVHLQRQCLFNRSVSFRLTQERSLTVQIRSWTSSWEHQRRSWLSLPNMHLWTGATSKIKKYFQ